MSLKREKSSLSEYTNSTILVQGVPRKITLFSLKHPVNYDNYRSRLLLICRFLLKDVQM